MLASVRGALALLDQRSKRILALFVSVQVLLAFLDLLGVLLLGLIAALSAAAVAGQPLTFLGNATSIFANLQGDIVAAILWIAFAAAILLVFKSVVSFLVFRRSFRFLANRQAMISGKLASQLLGQPLMFIQQRTTQESSFALVQGVNALTMGVLGGAVILVSESALLVVLTAFLILLDPLVALFVVAFFIALWLVLYFALGGWVRRLGKVFAETEVQSIASVQEAVRTYRETSITGRRVFVVERFQGLRWNAARVQADLQIANVVPKYVFEIALIVGAGLLTYLQILTKDVVAAVAIIAVFLAATGRILPALLRMQGAVLGLKSAAGVAALTYDLHNQIVNTEVNRTPSLEVFSAIRAGMDSGHAGFTPNVLVEGVCLTYPGSSSVALSDVTVDVDPGESLAIVGASGAGKSTLVDVLLGVIEPDLGHVRIGGMPPGEVSSVFPGAIAYVPQDVTVIDGSVRDNVSLGVPTELVDEDAVWEALTRASIDEMLRTGREGLETRVGENGIRLSGGQRQRLGLARALYSRPRLLVLDEATSALDVVTEQSVNAALMGLEGEVTLIVIAHRLATIRHCRKVAYLDKGLLKAVGSFGEVRTKQPDFDKQAGLSGL